MASSETSLCNQALALVGTRSTIASLSEDSNEAKACRLIYEDTRDEVLAKAHWGFAKKVATLAVLKTAPGVPGATVEGADVWSNAYPPPPWLYEYAYPSDCIAARYIVSNMAVGSGLDIPLTTNSSGGFYPYTTGPAIRFEIATDTDDNDAQIKVILTSQYQAILAYTMRIVNPQIFSDLFSDALIAVLAAKLVYPLTGERGRSGDLYEQANASIITARGQDGNEGLTVIDNVPDWIACRTDGLAVPNMSNYVLPYGPLYGGG